MNEVFGLALSFPCVVYTVLLGVVLVYWLFVVVGAIHIGEGSDGALDGFDPEGAIGAGKGALEGAAKGALQGHLDGMADAAGGDVGDVGDGGDVGGDGDGDNSETSAIALLVNALHLRSVPATTILSLIITFSWLVCAIGMQVVSRDLSRGSASWVSWLVFAVSPLVALPLTSIAARPLAKVFQHKQATQHSDLIGKTCVIRTGTVTKSFGEALLEDGGAGLVVRVRVDRELAVKRGDQMLIVDYDREHESFLVEPVDELLKQRV
jgi:hypothetical protein